MVKAAMDKWELHPSMVIIERCLGEGAFGSVFEGTAQGMAHASSPSCPSSQATPKVAIKLLSGGSFDLVCSIFMKLTVLIYCS